MDIQTTVTAITDLSPPVSLMIALNLLSFGIKRVPRVPNAAIPWVCPVVGAIVYPLVSDPSSVTFAVRYPVAAQTVTGFLMGWAAVGANEWAKNGGKTALIKVLQLFGLKIKSGDTTTIKKEDVKPEEKPV